MLNSKNIYYLVYQKLETEVYWEFRRSTSKELVENIWEFFNSDYRFLINIKGDIAFELGRGE